MTDSIFKETDISDISIDNADIEEALLLYGNAKDDEEAVRVSRTLHKIDCTLEELKTEAVDNIDSKLSNYLTLATVLNNKKYNYFNLDTKIKAGSSTYDLVLGCLGGLLFSLGCLSMYMTLLIEKIGTGSPNLYLAILNGHSLISILLMFHILFAKSFVKVLPSRDLGILYNLLDVSKVEYMILLLIIMFAPITEYSELTGIIYLTDVGAKVVTILSTLAAWTSLFAGSDLLCLVWKDGKSGRKGAAVLCNTWEKEAENKLVKDKDLADAINFLESLYRNIRKFSGLIELKHTPNVDRVLEEKNIHLSVGKLPDEKVEEYKNRGRGLRDLS